MKLDKVLFLAGFTARSQAYIQAMANAGLLPEHVLLFGPEKPALPGQTAGIKKQDSVHGLFIPDPDIPLKNTCTDNDCSMSVLSCESINDPEIISHINELSPSLIIYSGYGSQIVSAEFIGLGIPMLHMHAGWLPDYRGSTTLYYNWIKEKYCGVSVILLKTGIDVGPVILRKKYPLPPENIDPDYIYDSAIRADTLIDVLNYYSSNGKLPDPMEQTEDGTTYYVIHPVLKHLALLSKSRTGGLINK